ncbi:MAG: exodeoxyribonuclease VII large subunit [Bacteroidetes bacterium]|nr:exodeoxyribonuclease VII large subunit [Bacteroidota bacterium]
MNTSQLKLSEFCALIDDSLKKTFAGKTWWVLAEINSQNEKARSTWVELIEKSESGTDLVARMTGKVWRPEALAAFRNFEDITGKKPSQGMQVLLKLRADYHPVHGLSLDILDIDAQHMLGQLEVERRKTIALLATKPGIRLEDGIFITPNKKLELSSVIQHIAVISAASAAGYEDFMNALNKNIFGYKFFCTNYFSILQGETAADSMKEQLLKIFEDIVQGKKFDAVVLIRGGGSQSDLLPFDKFNLAHAIARFPVPVITGIGHLRNESITDMVAHTSTQAPTKAAEFIIDNNRAFEEETEDLRDLIAIRCHTLLTKHQRKLDHTGAILHNGTLQLIHTTENKMTRFRERISSSSGKLFLSHTQLTGEILRKLPSLTKRTIEKQDHQLELLFERMKLLSPENVLKRGYAMVLKNDQPVVSSKNISAGEKLEIRMKDGTLKTIVESNNE